MLFKQLHPPPSLAPFMNLPLLPSASNIISHDVLHVQTTAQGESLRPMPLLPPQFPSAGVPGGDWFFTALQRNKPSTGSTATMGNCTTMITASLPSFT